MPFSFKASLRILIIFWLCAWLGTCVGGSAFGVFAGPVGMVFGFFIAAAVGGPIHLAAFLLTLVGPLVRFRFALAVFAGMLTGVFSVASAMGGGVSAESGTAMTLAAVIGGLATFLVLRWFLRKKWLKSQREELFPSENQFTLSETFVFFTIVVGIFAVAAAAVQWKA